MSKVIQEIGSRKVFGVVTDNASSCVLAQELLAKEYESFSFYGCAAHVFNNVSKYICDCPSAKDVLSRAHVVVNEVKRSKVLRSEFKKIQKLYGVCTTSLKLFVKTRWSTQLYCLLSIVENKYNLEQLALKAKVTPKYKSIIFDDTFWFSVNKLVALLLANDIDQLEGSESVIYKVAPMFYRIVSSLNEEFRKELSLITTDESMDIFDYFCDQEQLLLKPIHFAAYILDLKTKGKELDSANYSKCVDLIMKLAKNIGDADSVVHNAFIDYKADRGIFREEFVQKSVALCSPLVLWETLSDISPLSKVAVGILSLPSSSADTERSFSTHGWIHSSKRNRLAASRAGKITYISHNLRTFQRKPKPRSNVGDDSEQEEEGEDEDEGEDKEEDSDAFSDEDFIEENKNDSLNNSYGIVDTTNLDY